MAKKKRRVLSPDELRRLEEYAGIRVPQEQIAALFEMPKITLERILQKQDAARDAYERGRAKASAKARSTLYTKAFIDKDVSAMKFWCQTQEGFRTTDVIEIQGIEVSGITDEELKARTEKLEKLILSRKR